MRITDDIRQAIIDQVKAGGTCRGIARETGVSTDSVRRVAREAGLTEAFSRELTKKATAAKQVDHKARLVALAGRYAGLAEMVLASFEAMTPEDWAHSSMHSRAILAGVAADKARDLAPDDSGAEQVISGLGRLFDQLIDRHGDGGD